MGRKRSGKINSVPSRRSKEQNGKPPIPPKKERHKPFNLSNAFIHTAVSLSVLSCAWYAYALYARHWHAMQVVTLHPSPRILHPNSTGPVVSPEKFWGSYRPQVYFGMKTRSPRSLVTGLMWMRQSGLDVHLRHTCEQGDGLRGYGWLMHDGVHFGVQEVRDLGFTLTTEFVKRGGGQHGGDWSWRVTANQESPSASDPLISLLFYVATDGQGTLQPHVEERDRLASVSGTTEELGHFRITFQKPTALKSTTPKHASYNYLKASSPGLESLTEVVKKSLNDRFMHSAPNGDKRHYIGVDTYRLPPMPRQGGAPTDDSFLVHQVTVRVPFQVEVVFESGSFMERADRLTGEVLTAELERHKAQFSERFERVFHLQEKGHTPQQVGFAKAALSNMVGGMGYFYGQSIVQSKYNEQPVAYPESPLYTAVPSRSFFPRGFLWDEGFHQLLVSEWDLTISKEVIAHWLDLMNTEGWIPREQILGPEARSKVPVEFVTQQNEFANPPTLFLALQKIIAKMGEEVEVDKGYLRRLFPRLQAWFEWYNTTQAGHLPHIFRWRGRDMDTNLFLNPKTLTSGLDDYPRASHPSEDERHVDLRCWMALASGIMADIAKLLGEPHQVYEEMHHTLSNNSLLEELHWSKKLKAFLDFGNHTAAVVLEREKIHISPNHAMHHHHLPTPRLVRVVRKSPKLQFINAFGYVSLFPFLLQILQPDSPKLEQILGDMRDEQKLWTPYGLRSLSRSDPLYMKRNTEHDAPYWRGPIWININYLAVRALHHYSSVQGPYQEMAASLYRELRTNLISNVYRQYEQTSYIWEQYNDSTGKGQGCHPFTGWSALLVLIMGEQY
ncbi:mannosyl-oligosaccharide glucosidase [Latimeria chalumnae]|uniref:Mannosyl-oligosaccharide glucosidase n=1 Tax=Latimeria chalumnae TaxID=7897 RepID=H3A3A1_LATCH|nr:PREDICTED: mannosyl-oligosaccharide glucosidase [Latimeria chalumnae]|eukprot:XP_006011279.1 PREDICTED: mannosyl-oligosaccharide glucosidase [Latimeria chalumnae]